MHHQRENTGIWKEKFLSFYIGKKKIQRGMAVAAQQGRGRIKDLLLGKAGSFFSDPKDLPGLQTLKKKNKKPHTTKNPNPKKLKQRQALFTTSF